MPGEGTGVVVSGWYKGSLCLGRAQVWLCQGGIKGRFPPIYERGLLEQLCDHPETIVRVLQVGGPARLGIYHDSLED